MISWTVDTPETAQLHAPREQSSSEEELGAMVYRLDTDGRFFPDRSQSRDLLALSTGDHDPMAFCSRVRRLESKENRQTMAFTHGV